MLKNIQNYPPEVHGLIQEVAISELAKHSPKSAVEMVGHIVNPELRNQVAERVVEHWVLSDVESTLDWIRTDELLSRHREILIDVALSSLTDKDPKLALETATKLPENSSGLGWESVVIRRMSIVSTYTAIELLPKVREGATQREAYEFSIMALLLLERDSDKAIDLLIDLCEKDSRGTTFSSPWFAQIDPRGVYERLDEMPSATAQATIANQMLSEHAETKVFSMQELNILKKVKESKPARCVPSGFNETIFEALKLKNE